MEKLAGDLLLGLKFVRLQILLTSFIDFLCDMLGEFGSRSLGLKGLTNLDVYVGFAYWLKIQFEVGKCFQTTVM